MVWARRCWIRLQGLLLRGRNAQQLHDEMQFHLEQQIAENLGANAAIFTVINAVMLRALPVKHPGELVTVGNPARVHSWGTGTPRTDVFSYPLYRELRDNQ